MHIVYDRMELENEIDRVCLAEASYGQNIMHTIHKGVYLSNIYRRDAPSFMVDRL